MPQPGSRFVFDLRKACHAIVTRKNERGRLPDPFEEADYKGCAVEITRMLATVDPENFDGSSSDSRLINDETFGLRKNCRGGVFHSRSINW